MKVIIKPIRWHGCAYQEVQPYNWTEWQHGWRDAVTWCTELFGPPGDVWAPVSSRWYRDHGRLLFRRSADLTAFLLRWS